jgi:beta-galactosidase
MKRYYREALFICMLLACFNTGMAQQTTRLTHNWQFIKQDLGGVWEAIRAVSAGKPEAYPIWSKVTATALF